MKRHNTNLYDSARDEFNLPEYHNADYVNFIAECYFMDLPLKDNMGIPMAEIDTSYLNDIIGALPFKVNFSIIGKKSYLSPKDKQIDRLSFN